MRNMTDDEKLMYSILVNNDNAKKSNWEAVREFYWQRYMIKLPKLDGMLTVWTIERMVRTLKSMYRECSNKESRQIKKEQEIEYKERALDQNKPMRPQEVKTEQVTLNGWW